MNRQTRVLVVLLPAVAMLLPMPVMSQTESPPVLAARQLAAVELLAGPDFTVGDPVPTDGFYGVFTVRGEYGSVQARGVAMLRVRGVEMSALARLEETTRREAVVGGARESARGTVQTAVEVGQNPVGAVEKVPDNVGALFSRLGGRVEKTVGNLSGGQDSSSSYEEREGIAKERRAIARELGVDPYTDNPLLSSRLDQVATWKRKGEIALAVATGSASLWAGVTTKTLNLVYSQPPEQVCTANEKRLSVLLPGTGAERFGTFLHNPSFTPTAQTIFVDQLESFPVPQARSALIALAGDMANRDQVRFLTAAMNLLTAYHESVTPLASVQVRGKLAVGLTPDGMLVLPAPVDCLAWTEKLADFGHRADFAAGKREILITGVATSLTRKGLSARGWSLREHFHGNPPQSSPTP